MAKFAVYCGYEAAVQSCQPRCGTAEGAAVAACDLEPGSRNALEWRNNRVCVYKPVWRFVTLAVMPAVVVSCSAIKIETGQTREEAVQSAEIRARQIRSDWANRFQQATPLEMGRLLTRHVDSVSARYVAYGFQVAAQWRDGNAGRGVNVPDREMREVVAAWTERQQPILMAYEDNLEYGLEQVKETRYFGQDFLDLLAELVDQYYKVYSAVFYPSGTVEEYEETLNRVKGDMESISGRFKSQLDRH